jgi:hypothetical protein
MPGAASKTFFPLKVDAYLFAHRSDTHLEYAYIEAWRRAYEDGCQATDRVIGLHCDGPDDIYLGALDGYEAAGCEVQLLEYLGPGQFVGKARKRRPGFHLSPKQAELVLKLVQDKMFFAGHRPELQEIANGINQTKSSNGPKVSESALHL